MGSNLTRRRVGAAVWAGRYLPPVIAHRVAPRLFPGAAPGEWGALPSLFGGGRLSPDFRNDNDRKFALYGTGNETGMAFATQVIERGALVFEIGANVGTETLSLSALVGESGRVVAVEPVAENRLLLCSRVEAAGASNVTIVPRAVDAAATELKVAHYDPRFSGAAYLAEVGEGQSAAETPEVVRATTLDALCAEFGEPSCVFMDIEGFEHRALRGGARLLQRQRPFLFLEVDSAYLARAGSSLAEIYELLRAHAYRAYRTSAIAIPEVRDGTAARRLHEDWIGIPAERESIVPRVRAALVRMRLMPRLPGLNPLSLRPR